MCHVCHPNTGRVDTMDVCEVLNSVRKLDQLIDAKLAERERLMSIAKDISPRLSDGMPRGNSGMPSQKMADAVCALVDLEKETDRLVDKYVDTKKQIANVLEKLPEKEYGVLHRYYMRNMTWEQVAEDMGYSMRQVYRIKQNGMEMLQDVIECHHISVI